VTISRATPELRLTKSANGAVSIAADDSPGAPLLEAYHAGDGNPPWDSADSGYLDRRNRGHRGAPLYQCARCHYLPDSDPAQYRRPWGTLHSCSGSSPSRRQAQLTLRGLLRFWRRSVPGPLQRLSMRVSAPSSAGIYRVNVTSAPGVSKGNAIRRFGSPVPSANKVQIAVQ
jgi:hypothetical protein